MSEKIICSISHITKEFPGVKALDDVNFDVREGEIHAIVGENGAGKSTLMNILSGVYKPTSGKIIFDGKEVSPNAPVEASALGIAMIHQELSLSHTLSVAENIFQARQPKSKLGLIDKKKLYADSRRLLDEVGLKDMDPSTLVRDINASQQQRLLELLNEDIAQGRQKAFTELTVGGSSPTQLHFVIDERTVSISLSSSGKAAAYCEKLFSETK